MLVGKNIIHVQLRSLNCTFNDLGIVENLCSPKKTVGMLATKVHRMSRVESRDRSENRRRGRFQILVLPGSAGYAATTSCHPRCKVQRRNRGRQIASSSRCCLTPGTKIQR